MLQSYPTQLRPARRVFQASNRGNATKKFDTAVKGLSDIARFPARCSKSTQHARFAHDAFGLFLDLPGRLERVTIL